MATTFHSFPRLPPEVRSMIWEYALPEPRVYEVLDSPNAKQKTPPRDGLMFANVHREPPPPLAAACRESRFFVLRHYRPLTLSGTTKHLDLSRDVLLLEPYLLVKRLLRTLHFLSQVADVRELVTRLALGTSYGLHTGICHPVLSWRVSKGNMAKLLARLAKFPRLRKLVFVVHQEFQFDFDLQHQHQHQHQHHGLHSPSPNPLLLAGMHAHAAHPRPQLVHQAYRFKFDIETNINHHHPRRPHENSFLYYPLRIDEDRDDHLYEDIAAMAAAASGSRGATSGVGAGVGGGGGGGGGGCCEQDYDPLGDEFLDEGGEWCDPWPTNDDWRRFRRRFAKAVWVTANSERGVKMGAGLPGLEGASLLWRYGGDGARW